jgi:hypothetical protein
MDRLPIRFRLTLAFTIVMAVVLAATGLFLYVRLGSALNRTIDQGLRARATDIATLAQQADTGLQDARHLRTDSGFAQVVGPRGNVIDSTPVQLTRGPLLDAPQLARARQAPTFFGRTLAGEEVRLLAVPVTAQGQRVVVVVGASLEPRGANG